MNSSPQLKALFDCLYEHIKRDAEHEIKVLLGQETLYTGPMKYRSVLQRYLTSDEAVEAFRRVLEMFGQSVIYELMGILQGEGPEEYAYGLTDTATGENLYPASGYRDEWVDYAYIKDAGLEE